MKRKLWLNTAGYVLLGVSLLLAGKAAYGLLKDPAMYTDIGPDGQPTHASLVQINGEGAIPKVLFPVALVLVALVPKRRVRITAMVLLLGFVLLASFTIGLFYFPAAMAMLGGVLLFEVAARVPSPRSSSGR